MIKAGGDFLGSVISGLFGLAQEPQKVRQPLAPLEGAGFQMALDKYLGG